MRMTRRMLLVGSAAAVLASRSYAVPRTGYVIGWQGAAPDPAVAASLEAQIRLVEALPISAEAMAFFRGETIHVDREAGTRTRAGRGVYWAREVVPADNPVLLHELIHRWQIARMPGGQQNSDVHRFYRAALSSGRWPARSYMLSNAFEFFAMCASVVLHGRAARPPFTRAAAKAAMPDVHAFIVAEFGLRSA